MSQENLHPNSEPQAPTTPLTKPPQPMQGDNMVARNDLVSPTAPPLEPPPVATQPSAIPVAHHEDATGAGVSSVGVAASQNQSIPGEQPISKPSIDVARSHELFERATAEISKVFVGQEELVSVSLIALFSGGHILIEGVPGLGKTLFVRTLGRVLGCEFGRIQFTADLMPSDITGAPILDLKTQDFKFRPGPVFTQFLLADEINRSPAKTHAALLEIMQEYRVTIDGVSHKVPRPFLVMATQNPIESEGTYSLPEAQLDRFMFKAIVSYPSEQEEARILVLHSQQIDLGRILEGHVKQITNGDEIQAIIKTNAKVRVEPKLVDYINKIVRATREWPAFHIGASPRAGLAILQGVRTLAAFRGRDYAVPDDVIEIAIPALRHRVVLSAEAEVEGLSTDRELQAMIRGIEVPRL